MPKLTKIRIWHLWRQWGLVGHGQAIKPLTSEKFDKTDLRMGLWDQTTTLPQIWVFRLQWWELRPKSHSRFRPRSNFYWHGMTSWTTFVERSWDIKRQVHWHVNVTSIAIPKEPKWSQLVVGYSQTRSTKNHHASIQPNKNMSLLSTKRERRKLSFANRNGL